MQHHVETTVEIIAFKAGATNYFNWKQS